MGDSASTPSLYSARPRVMIEGKLDSEITAELTSLLVEETIEGLFRCEVTFANWGNTDSGSIGYLHSNSLDSQKLSFGKAIAVNIGAGSKEAKVFDGRITGLEGHYMEKYTPEIVVLAEDRFQDLRMTRRTRTFEDMSDGDVIRQIASKHGLRSDIDVDGSQHRVLAQVNQSDLSFIRDRARAVDAEVWIEGSTLHAQARSRRNAGSIKLTYQIELKEFSVFADLANQRTGLGVSGWDVSSKDGINFEASESAISQELNGKSGGNLLQNAFGKRAEQIVHLVPHTIQEAQFLAEAHYRRIARRFVTGYGITDGDGRIGVGTFVELFNLGKMFEGKYYVTEVRHTFDMQNGSRTYFGVERAWIG